MQFIVKRVDGLDIPIIFDDHEIKMIEFDMEDRQTEVDMPKGFPKNYPGQSVSYVNKPVYTITMSFKDGEQKKLIFEMADRQLWVQAMNKLCSVDVNLFEKNSEVKRDESEVKIPKHYS